MDVSLVPSHVAHKAGTDHCHYPAYVLPNDEVSLFHFSKSVTGLVGLFPLRWSMD